MDNNNTLTRQSRFMNNKIKALKLISNLENIEVIKNSHIEGKLKLNEEKHFKKISFINCKIDFLQMVCIEFKGKIELINCEIKDCNLSYSYFKEGLVIKNCTFDSYLDFQAGGHNNKPIHIIGNTFKEFVSFFDCWFFDEVVLQNNTFIKGTNILGNIKEAVSSQFDNGLIESNNIGRINVDGQGDIEINIIGSWKLPN